MRSIAVLLLAAYAIAAKTKQESGLVDGVDAAPADPVVIPAENEERDEEPAAEPETIDEEPAAEPETIDEEPAAEPEAVVEEPVAEPEAVEEEPVIYHANGEDGYWFNSEDVDTSLDENWWKVGDDNLADLPNLGWFEAGAFELWNVHKDRIW